MIQIELEEDKAQELSIWIEHALFDEIRNDSEIDSLLWLQYWLDIIKKLRGSIYERKRISEISFKNSK